MDCKTTFFGQLKKPSNIKRFLDFASVLQEVIKPHSIPIGFISHETKMRDQLHDLLNIFTYVSICELLV